MIRKIDVAKQYLEDALRLYTEARFLSALTLAGAAEEILGKSLEMTVPMHAAGVSIRPISALGRDAESVAAFDQKLVEIGAPNFTPKSLPEIRRELLLPRNSAKHFNSLEEAALDFDAQLEAGNIIIRAIRNYRLVFPEADDHFVCEEQDISVDQVNKLNPFGSGKSVA